MIFVTLLRDLGGWEWREDRLGDGGDLTPSAIGSSGGASIGEGIEPWCSCSTNEGSVIVDISSDRFDPQYRVPPEYVTFLSGGVGSFRGEGCECKTPGTPEVGAQPLETTEGVMDPRVETTELDVAISGCCGPWV